VRGGAVTSITVTSGVRRIAESCNAHGKLARGSAETEAQIEEY
jgi:hypothetical protein